MVTVWYFLFNTSWIRKISLHFILSQLTYICILFNNIFNWRNPKNTLHLQTTFGNFQRKINRLYGFQPSLQTQGKLSRAFEVSGVNCNRKLFLFFKVSSCGLMNCKNYILLCLKRDTRETFVAVRNVWKRYTFILDTIVCSFTCKSNY